MQKIGRFSKRGEYYVYLYERSAMHTLFDAYKEPSDRKIQADRYCRNLCDEEQGYAYKIISANSFSFTAAWLTPAGDLRIKTPSNSYVIKGYC